MRGTFQIPIRGIILLRRLHPQERTGELELRTEKNEERGATKRGNERYKSQKKRF